jgi:hypothetical protein
MTRKTILMLALLGGTAMATQAHAAVSGQCFQYDES